MDRTLRQVQQQEAAHHRPGKPILQETREVLQPFLKPAVTFLSSRDELADPSLLAVVGTPDTGRLPKQTARAPMLFPTNEIHTHEPEIPPGYCWRGSDLIL